MAEQPDLQQQNLNKQKKVILNIFKKNNSLNTNCPINNLIPDSDTINLLTNSATTNSIQNQIAEKKEHFNEDPVASGESSISKSELSSLTRISLMKKNSCLLSSSSSKKQEDADEEPGHKLSALKRFRKAAFGIKFTQTLGRDLNSELNKEFVDLKNANDFQIVVDLLEKTTKKTMREILFLKRAVEGLRFFQQRKDNLNPKLYEILFDEFKVKLFKKQEVIYHYGDAPHNFYIVLKGSCYLLTPSDEQKTRNQQFEFNRLKGLYDQSRNGQVISLESSNTYFSGFSTETAKKNSKFGSKSSLLNSPLHTNKSNDNPEYWDSFNNFLNLCFSGFQVTCDYLPGDSFGDLALTTRSKQAGTVVLGEDSYLLMLTKEGYEHILGEEQKQIVKNKINYFRQFQFLKNFSDAGLINMLSSLCNLSYKKGDTIYKEGDRVNFVYFILNGEVELSQICESQQDQLNNNHNKNNSEEQNQINQITQNSSNNLTDNPDGRFTNLNSVLEEKKRQNGQILVKFAVLANNSCFGELEIIQQNKQRFQQAICHSLSLQLYAIKKEVLVNYLKAFEGYKLLEEYSNTAQSERSRRIEKAILTSQIMMQSQLKEAQKINYTKSFSEKNVLSTLGTSTSVDNLHAQVIPQNIIQPAAFTSRTTRYNTDIHHEYNITQNNNNNNQSVDQQIMGFRNQHNPQILIENNQGQILSTGNSRIIHQTTNINSYDQSVPSQNVNPTKQELQMEMLEQTRQKIIQDLKLIDKKKRKIFSQLKNAQHSVPVSDAVNASSLDFGTDGSKKQKKNQKKQEILFDYLFVQNPLLNKILSPKDSLNNTRKHASSSRASLEHVSKQNSQLMGAIHKSMERYKEQQTSLLNALPANDNHRLPSLTSRKEEFQNNGYLSCINLASNSTTKLMSDQKIQQNLGDIANKNDFQAHLAQKRDSSSIYPSKKDQPSSTSFDNIPNNLNQLHQNTHNIHTEVLKLQKANNHALNSSNPTMKTSLSKNVITNSSFPSLQQIISPHQKNFFEDINTNKNNNFPSSNSINAHNSNNLSCNSSRFSLPNMSVNSIPSRQLLPQQLQNRNLTNQPTGQYDPQTIISHSLFHPISSPKRAFSINQHFKSTNNTNNNTPKNHIIDNNSHFLSKINNHNQNSESKLINRYLSNVSSSPQF